VLGNLSLVAGWFPPVVVVLALLALAASLAWNRRAALRQLLLGARLAAALVGIAGIIDDGLALIPYQFPNSYYFWFGLIALAFAWCILGWRGRRLWQQLVSILSILLTAVMAMTLVNQHYGYYPTLATVFGQEAQHQVNITQLTAAQHEYRRTHRLPGNGFTVSLPVPGTKSGFRARPAYVWLPPAWVANPTPRLPVIELIAGTPSDPSDWTRAGFADQTAQTFALQHGGRAPILIMPDANGSTTGDTECVNSALGNAETYLTVDVPAFVRKTFHASTDDDSLAIAGLSEGGMCSLMLSLRHPKLYPSFADFSGLTSPTVLPVVDRSATIAALFAGSASEYDAHDPLHLLSTGQYPDLDGWFDVGLSDLDPLAAQRTLVPLARSAGISTCATEWPGGHNYEFWSEAFRRALPWLCSRLELIPRSDQGCGA
jgi:enterochelin esterase-like enzyme